MKRSGPPKRRTPLKRTGFTKDRVSAQLARTRAKRKTLAVPKDVYQEVLARDHGCRAAGVAPGQCAGRIDPHHVLRRSQGGPDTVENLISLCRLHHSWVHEHPAESYAFGFLKHGWDQ